MVFSGQSIHVQYSWMYAIQKCMVLSRHSAKEIIFITLHYTDEKTAEIVVGNEY